jgi:hypothetical protein
MHENTAKGYKYGVLRLNALPIIPWIWVTIACAVIPMQEMTSADEEYALAKTLN